LKFHYPEACISSQTRAPQRQVALANVRSILYAKIPENKVCAVMVAPVS
jgi:hypothetical protein